MTLGPRSLGARIALQLVLGLAIVDGAGLLIHARSQFGLERIAELHALGARVLAFYRAVATGDTGAIARMPALHATVAPAPGPLPPRAPATLQRSLRPFLAPVGLPPGLRPIQLQLRGTAAALLIAMHLPDDRWLLVHAALPPPQPWRNAGLGGIFPAMLLASALLAFWAAHRLTAPVRALAAAADRLGRDVNAPALAEDGPAELAQAAAAFNRMAARIRRYVDDRTLLLASIGHDLRTPITRLKLRAELIDDAEHAPKMLADLDELESMVAATLAFGRDVAASEPAIPLDLAALLRTVLDEAADARPALATAIHYDGPDRLAMQGRPVALKRALANLVGNALGYGGAARAKLTPPTAGLVRVEIDDDGPGLPPAEIERVFEPFYRVEPSRSRETGGTGLGLPIVRNILRAHGGDVVLVNRPGGGLRAVVTLPA